jgi:hypothetical protein
LYNMHCSWRKYNRNKKTRHGILENSLRIPSPFLRSFATDAETDDMTEVAAVDWAKRFHLWLQHRFDIQFQS